MKTVRSLLALIVATLISTNASNAAIIATDTASDTSGVYDNGWQTGDNGGTGFGAWTLQNGHSFFISSSTVNADGSDNGTVGGVASDGDINTPDRPLDEDGINNAWGFKDNGGSAADALRNFNAALQIGDTFRIDMDNGYIDTGATVGFGLQNSTSGQNKFEFFFVGGNSTYTYVDEGGSHSSTIGYTDEGLTIEFTLTGADSYSATFTTRGGAVQTVSGDLGGATDGEDVDRFRGFIVQNNTADSHILFFNSMEIDSLDAVPEPTIALLLVAGGGLIYSRRRHLTRN